MSNDEKKSLKEVFAYPVLQVSKPQQYGFYPERLLQRVCEWVVRILERGPAFASAIGMDPDFNEALLRTAHGQLLTVGGAAFGLASAFENLISQVCMDLKVL